VPRTTIFVSYSHKDERWLSRLRVHLKPYDRSGALDLWDDTKIAPGDNWRSKIDDAMKRAVASVLLISADFLASDFVAIYELPKLLRQAELGGVRILPIVVEPCNLTHHPELASFQAVNSPQRPLARIGRAAAEGVLVQVVDTIGRLLAVSSSADASSPEQRRHDSKGQPSSADASIFDELQLATITLSLLWALAPGQDYSLSELETALQLQSRKRAFEALSRLTASGWIAKNRIAGSAKYRLTAEGVRQLQRLVATTDGPVRRAAVSR
jgi:TIR domain